MLRLKGRYKGPNGPAEPRYPAPKSYCVSNGRFSKLFNRIIEESGVESDEVLM
jgi:hypothetical protein